jgi:hypothetical protein
MGAGSALAARGASGLVTTIGAGTASGSSFGAINSTGTQLNTTGTIDIGQLAGDTAIGGISGGVGGALAYGVGKGVSGIGNKVNPARSPNVDKSLNAIEDFLGFGYKKDYAPNGSVILKSADGTKQIRFDINDFHGDAGGPHINVEEFVPKYPGSSRMNQVSNDHIYIK